MRACFAVPRDVSSRERAAACASFAAALAIAVVGAPAAVFGEDYPPGTRVEVDGRFENGAVTASKVVREEPDDRAEIKGRAVRIDPAAGIVEIPPFIIEVPLTLDIEDRSNRRKTYDLDEIQPEWRLNIEVEPLGDGRFKALDVKVDRRAGDDELEIEAFVEDVRVADDGAQVLVLLGVPCRITTGTGIVQEIHTKTRRVFVDQDDARPEEQLVLWNVLTIGGEVQVEEEYRDDYDLDKHDNEDTSVIELSATLEGTLDLGRTGYAFAKGRSAKPWVISDEERDLHTEEVTTLEELHVYFDRPFTLPVGLQVGRQDFDEKREWLYDRNLDAARLYVHGGRDFELEYSWSAYLADAPRGFSEKVNQIAFARWLYGEESYAGVYMIDIRDGSDADDSPFFLGGRLIGKEKAWRYWAEYAYLDGTTGTQRLEGHGIDGGGGHQFRDLPLEPYVYAGYAWGSGDGHTTGGRTNREFRQTGYQDNNDRMFGVASYSYYGELLRPELSNLHIATVGAGIRPVRKYSVDVVYHYYRQDERAPRLRDTRLRASPSGLSRDIGDEVDLVLGADKLFRHLDVEVDVGYFMPGTAFTTHHHPALWLAIKLEWNF